MKTIYLTRINNNVNGIPRYVAHFLDFIKTNEKLDPNRDLSINELYDLALSRSRAIGGKKFHNKQFGGGIVFQSYNKYDLESRIIKLTS